MKKEDRIKELNKQIEEDVKVGKKLRNQLIAIQKRIWSNKERLDELENIEV